MYQIIFEEKVIGVDWGDDSRWVLVGRTAKNKSHLPNVGGRSKLFR
jgi:hypothetical protein